MGLLSVYEMVQIVRKKFLRVLAFSVLIALVTYFVLNSMQTYTCVLGFKYNHSGAETGLAPDGESKLDPYEIQNPLVIQGALQSLTSNSQETPDLKGVRQNITISKVVSELDMEVTESAALLGEKYEVVAVEYEMTFKYDAKYGDEFGTKMFSAIINEYDEFLLNKYYKRKNIADFAKIVKGSSADYIDISDSMASEIDSAIEYLNNLAAEYPDFRSQTTGYTFAELAALYQNIRNIQHAKYYGNIRAGNLAKDPEMVIKSYQSKVKELEETKSVNSEVAENYKASITTFYDPYKASGLYRQAEKVQTETDSSNNRDQDVLEDYDIEEHKNTYDNIILSYVDNATKTTDATHTVDYYTSIIESFSNDMVPAETKERLLKENEKIFKEIEVLSADYAKITNETTGELFNREVTNDLQYLIAPEVVTDKPVKMITIFAFVLAFGALLIGYVLAEFLKRFIKSQESKNSDETSAEYADKKVINTEELADLETIFYEQYKKDFPEFYLVYQDMVSTNDKDEMRKEVYIRWRNDTLGMVPPGKIVDTACKLELFEELNKWIIRKVCDDISAIQKTEGEAPVVHINCPSEQIKDFAVSDIIVNCVKKNKIPAEKLCFELDGDNIADCLEDIMLLKHLGVSVCIDHFENSEENREIISVIEPQLVKLSMDILNNDMYATTKDDYLNATQEMIDIISEIIENCHKNKIKVCICGIENKSQEQTISDLGFDYKQGYYYSKPVELEL